jgi:ABC-type Fe3+-hydroxamate transport system substrate-binding protein
MKITDDLGRDITLRGPAQRILCLVPSITETLFALEAGDRVAGITDFCVHPARRVRNIPKFGGTKTPRLAEIIALRPDLIIANAEENRQHHIRKLESAGLTVFVNFTKTVDGCVKMMHDLGALTGKEKEAATLASTIQEAMREAATRRLDPPPRILGPIWKNPYMSINSDTFVGNILEMSGGQNVFETDPERYPQFALQDLLEKKPEIILLPTEPYRFMEADMADFEALGPEVPAVRNRRIHIVEGELLSWYGPRVPRALREISTLIASARG